MSSKFPFPLEIIIKIAKLLYFKECFVELEIVMYIFPKLNELFSHKIPTIALVDDDQYDKFNNFIHSRARPFGSRNLFIIKQPNTLKVNKHLRLKSKCYMILGSKCYQELIPKEFDRLQPYLTIVENTTLIEKNCDPSYKCYELECTDTEVNPNLLLMDPIFLRNSCRYTFHVALLLYTFLKHIDPRLLRFESYSGKNDLYFESSDLYDIYSSLLTMKHDRRIDFDDHFTKPSRKDYVIDTPKCSFEYVKDIREFTSLYQYSKPDQTDTWEWIVSKISSSQTSEIEPSNNSVKSWFKKKLGYDKPADCMSNIPEKTAFFYSLKDFTVNKIISKTQESSIDSHLLIDCSKSAVPNGFTYNFLPRYYFFLHSEIPRHLRLRSVQALNSQEVSPGALTVDELETRARLSPRTSKFFQHYIDLFYKDFTIEKLQSADITAFDPSTSRTTPKMDTKKCSNDFNLSNKPNLKHLECQINKLATSIQELRNIRSSVRHRETLCEMLSLEIMETIVREIQNGLESELGLNKDQPFKLRVFDNSTQRIQDRERYECLNEWFSRRLTC